MKLRVSWAALLCLWPWSNCPKQDAPSRKAPEAAPGLVFPTRALGGLRSVPVQAISGSEPPNPYESPSLQMVSERNAGQIRFHRPLPNADAVHAVPSLKGAPAPTQRMQGTADNPVEGAGNPIGGIQASQYGVRGVGSGGIRSRFMRPRFNSRRPLFKPSDGFSPRASAAGRHQKKAKHKKGRKSAAHSSKYRR